MFILVAYRMPGIYVYILMLPWTAALDPYRHHAVSLPGHSQYNILYPGMNVLFILEA